jgi:hypothetical protein
LRSRKNTLRKNGSGQLLIVAALAIALLISSTTTYVYEVTRETDNAEPSPASNLVLAMKQTTRNAMISSLANISNGGARDALMSNLDEFSEAVNRLSQFGVCSLDRTVLDESGYNSGTRLEWGASGLGVSSAYGNFTLHVQDMASTMTTKFAVNVTTSLAVNGSYVTLSNGEKNVSLICYVGNDGLSSLAESLRVFYHDASNWTQAGTANGLTVTDYGDGTYVVSFTAAVADSVQVSVQAVDLRGIFVRADTTCPES